MKKGLLFTLLLVLGSVCPGWGQWVNLEKEYGLFSHFIERSSREQRKEILPPIANNGIQVVGNRMMYISKDSFYKNLTNTYKIFISSDKGQTWKSNNFNVGPTTIGHLDIKLTQEGIYYSNRGYRSNGTYLNGTDIIFSRDFGVKWDTTFIESPRGSNLEVDNSMLYLYGYYRSGDFNKIDSSFLFRCKVGGNSWTKNKNHPKKFDYLYPFKNKIIYQTTGLAADTFCLVNFEGKELGKIIIPKEDMIFKSKQNTTLYNDSTIIFNDRFYSLKDLKQISNHSVSDLIGNKIFSDSKNLYSFSSKNGLISKSSDSGKTWVDFENLSNLRSRFNLNILNTMLDVIYGDSLLYIVINGEFYSNIFKRSIRSSELTYCKNINYHLLHERVNSINVFPELRYDYGYATYGLPQIGKPQIFFNKKYIIYDRYITKRDSLDWQLIPKIVPTFDNVNVHWMKDGELYQLVITNNDTVNAKTFKLNLEQFRWDLASAGYSKLSNFGKYSYRFYGDSVFYVSKLRDTSVAGDFYTFYDLSLSIPPYDSSSTKIIIKELVQRGKKELVASNKNLFNFDGRNLYVYNYSIFTDNALYRTTLTDSIIFKRSFVPNALQDEILMFLDNKITYIQNDTIFRIDDKIKMIPKVIGSLSGVYDKNQVFKIKRLTNGAFLLFSSIGGICCKNYVGSGGVIASNDEGKTWFKANEGLETEDNLPINGLELNYITQIGDYVYYGKWRRHIDDFKYRSISGNCFLDSNNNGKKDSTEIYLANQIVFNSRGAYAVSDTNGYYALFIDQAQSKDTIYPKSDNKYVKIAPLNYVINSTDSTIKKNFAFFIPLGINDLQVVSTAITPPRSGLTNSYLLTYKNAGAITKSGKVAFTYNAKQTYVEATQAPTSNANNTLSWDYANLQPNETRTLKVTFKTAADVPIRTQLTNVATIEPIATDTFKTDNVDSLFQIVVGSYDPNDKQVSFLNTRQAPSVIDPNTEMTYTIRFQNTGNYQADFVRVTDTLSDKLDLTTLRVLATSHNYALSVKNKNVLQFEFNPIYLPDSTTNEKESHGFIKFAIKPKKTLTKDEVIKNTAYIFFDYNPAIITNTVETANQKVNGLFTPSVLESLSVFPNPTNGEISFSLDKYQGKALSINVYSIDGKLMMNKHTVGEAVNRINGESLRNGLYVLQVRVGDDVVFGRFMVQK